MLNEGSNSRFVIRKWNIFNDQSNADYHVGNEIIYNAEEVSRYNLSDYNDSYILVKGNVRIVGNIEAQVALKKMSTIP